MTQYEIHSALTKGLAGARGSADAALVLVMMTNPSQADLTEAADEVMAGHQRMQDSVAGWEKDEKATEFWGQQALDAAGRRQQQLDVLARAERVLAQMEAVGLIPRHPPSPEDPRQE